MKIIEPNVTEVTDFEGVDNFYKAVARAARICYASDKTTDDKELCERLIKSKHFSPFEHAIIYVSCKNINELGKTNNNSTEYQVLNNARNCIKYIVDKYNKEEQHYELAINGRVLIETVLDHSDYPMQTLDGTLQLMKQFELDKHWFKSFIVDTSIGCTREMNRHHDNFYICEQSTRFCNFSKNKFGNEVAFNKPYWYDGSSFNKEFIWTDAMLAAENAYLCAIKNDVPIDIARGVLPLDTHTRAIYTATIEEWNHIIDLRLKGTTGKPHGDIKVIAEKINNLLYDNNKSVK